MIISKGCYKILNNLGCYKILNNLNFAPFFYFIEVFIFFNIFKILKKSDFLKEFQIFWLKLAAGSL